MPEHAWVRTAAERAAVDAALRDALCGRAILAVRYVGLDYSPPLGEGRRFHAIDYGFELDLAGGETWSMTWEQAGGNEGLLVAPGPVPVTLGGEVVRWDFTALWRERFPQGVRRVETVWTRHSWGPAMGGPNWDVQLDDGGTSDLCLTTVLLEDVVVTLGGGDGAVFSRAQFDIVSVFFSLADARSAGALLPGDEDAISA